MCKSKIVASQEALGLSTLAPKSAIALARSLSAKGYRHENAKFTLFLECETAFNNWSECKEALKCLGPYIFWRKGFFKKNQTPPCKNSQIRIKKRTAAREKAGNEREAFLFLSRIFPTLSLLIVVPFAFNENPVLRLEFSGRPLWHHHFSVGRLMRKPKNS